MIVVVVVIALILTAFVAGYYSHGFIENNSSRQTIVRTFTRNNTMTEISVAYSTVTTTVGGLQKFTFTKGIIEETLVIVQVMVGPTCTFEPPQQTIWYLNSTRYNVPSSGEYFNATVVTTTVYTTSAATTTQSVSYCTTS